MTATCTLLRGAGQAGACDWCAGPLTGRQRRWCSDDCITQFQRQHVWPIARWAALTRDGHRCTSCGADPKTYYVDTLWSSTTILPVLPGPGVCVVPLYTNDWNVRHRWADHARPIALEVNHIEPRVGAGYSAGCWNHLDNLETLCHRCHVRVTTNQGRARRGLPPVPDVVQLELGA